MRMWWICVNTGEGRLNDIAAVSREAVKIGRYPTDEVVPVIEAQGFLEVLRALEVVAGYEKIGGPCTKALRNLSSDVIAAIRTGR